MVKVLRRLANWLECTNRAIAEKWNALLNRMKLDVKYCQNCKCEK